jgi:hypothetical protein
MFTSVLQRLQSTLQFRAQPLGFLRVHVAHIASPQPFPVRLRQSARRVHQRRPRSHQSGSCPDHRQIRLVARSIRAWKETVHTTSRQADIESLSERIGECNERIEELAQESYPQVALLKQIKGVGTLIGLTFLLTLEDPHRFGKSRWLLCNGSYTSPLTHR